MPKQEYFRIAMWRQSRTCGHFFLNTVLLIVNAALKTLPRVIYNIRHIGNMTYINLVFCRCDINCPLKKAYNYVTTKCNY